MSKNTGIPFEQFVSSLYDSIINENSVRHIEVKHNQVIQGLVYKHQIDVYWEFEVGGLIYRTIVEAKDWSTSVPKERVLIFKAIIDDLPAGTHGLMVAKTGFQKGAKEIAKAHGISLCTLRQPTIDDYKNNLSDLRATIGVKRPLIKDLKLYYCNEWIVANHIDIDLMNIDTNSLVLFKGINEKFEEFLSLRELIYNYCFKIGYDCVFLDEKFDEIYIKDENQNYIKVIGLSGYFGLLDDIEFFEFTAKDLVGSYLKDIFSGKITPITSTGRVIDDSEWGNH